MIQAIIVLISVLVGWTLRGYRIQQVREIKKQIRKKIMPDKSGVVDWVPPKSQEEEASAEVLKGMKK